jgi:hypothetical protein
MSARLVLFGVGDLGKDTNGSGGLDSAPYANFAN